MTIHPYLAVVAALISGCASISAADRVHLKPVQMGSNSIQIVDQRSPDAKVYREHTDINTTKFLGDEAFEPRILDVLSSRVGDAISKSTVPVHAVLTRLDVGVYISPLCRTLTLVYGAPPGAVIGYEQLKGPVYTLSCLRTSESAVAYIHLQIGDAKIETAQNMVVTTDNTMPIAIQKVTTAAIEEVVAKSSALAATNFGPSK